MTRKHKLGIKLLMVALGVILILTSFVGCTTKSEKQTLVFADLLWDSALFHNRVAAFILEHGYGYDIEYTPGVTIPLFAGLASGDIDISMEIWVENQDGIKTTEGTAIVRLPAKAIDSMPWV